MRLFVCIASILLVHQVSAQKIQQFRVDKSTNESPVNHWIIDPSDASSRQDPEQEVRLIIRLRSEPSKAPAQGRQQNTTLQNEHAQFIEDLNQLSQSATSSRSKIETVIRHEYTNTFNGFAITTSQAIKSEIIKLPYVVKVTEDKQVEAFDVTSNGVIRAPQAWQQFGVTGKNVTIGIIDTGIDYNHPELGQGFGPGFKVVGGYDFVNDDNDPIDDHGHGTHVAGIAAGNGSTLKGVAPDANLVAYKVLSSGGSGYDSWILAAIERCVDPDQNPNTDDALDVVNMSLGRYADPEEPMSEAVNNATAQGVVFVVAAGNSGAYQTIGTPGVAKNAITVGATDNWKYTAYFSSKGPTERTLLMKPEVSAPGVDIYSSFLNGTYQALSGTSMASPHVAGAVALLLEKNQSWTPDMVKSVLMGTSRSSAPVLFDQGSGVIDIYDALNAKFICSPGVVDFGEMQSTLGTVQKTVTLTISNKGTGSASFNLNAEGAITQAPFSIAITPSFFTLNSNESKQVLVSLEANSANVALLNLPEAYSGMLNIVSEGITQKAPIFFLNPQKTTIHFTGELPPTVIVVGIEGSNYWKPFYPSTPLTELLLPKGKYDLISLYYDFRTVISEGVNTDANVELTLDKSLASNLISFKPLDVDGNAIPLETWAYGGAFFSGNDRNIFTSVTGLVDSLYISDQEHYRWEFKGHGQVAGSNTYYEIVAGTDFGISERIICSNDPEKFSKIEITNPSVGESQTQHMNFYLKTGAPGFWITSWNTYPIEVPSTFSLYQTQHTPASGFIGSFFSFSPLPGQSGYIWETADIRAEEGNRISFYKHIDRKVLTLEQKDLTHSMGGTIPNFIMKPNHNAAAIQYLTFVGRGAFDHAFGERSHGTTRYKLYSEEAIIKEGVFNQALYTQTESIFPAVENLPPGKYNLDFEYSDFQTAGKFAKATLYTEFNTNQSDLNPPALKSLRLLVAEQDVNQFDKGQTAVLKFSVNDLCEEFCYSDGLKTPVVKIKNEDSIDWTTLPVQTTNAEDFLSSLSADLPEGYYSLRIVAEDNSGNKITYEVSPAFHIGTSPQSVPYTTINLIEPKNYSQNAGTTPLFRWTPLEAVSYVLQITDDPTFTGNVIQHHTTDNYYQLVTPLEENKTFFWRVKPSFQASEGNWSSIFSFQSKYLPRAELLTPANHSTIEENFVTFSWVPVPQASFYWLEVSYDQEFSQLQRIEFAPSSELTLHSFSPNTKHYWRVKSVFWYGWEEEQSISSVFDFTIGPLDTPTLISPINDAIDQPLHLTFEWSPMFDVNQYYFELSKDVNFSMPAAQYNLNQNSSGIVALAPETEYFWRVSSINSDGSVRGTSVTNKLRTAALVSPLLVAPSQGALDVIENTALEWLDNSNLNQYVVQISNNETFTSIELEASTNQKTYFLHDLQSYTKYFWRVLSRVNANNQLYEISSATFNFTTSAITALGDFERTNRAHVYPNPFEEHTDFVITSERDCAADLMIIDNLGKTIHKFSMRLNSGQNTIHWNGRSTDGTSTSPGLYTAILAKEKGATVVIRLAKTR